MAEAAASTCLTLREIENELSEVTGEDWYPLGVQLGLRQATLREIQKNYPLDTERCRREMLDLWLHSAPKVSWKSLAQAVQGLGRYTSLAQQLRRKVPPAPKAPSAPTIVSVEATSSTSISVQWNACTNDGGSPITGYVVEYHVASDPASSFETQVVTRDVFSMTLDGLTPSTEYDVRVRGENAVGCSVASTTMRTKTDGFALTASELYASGHQIPPQHLYSSYEPTSTSSQLSMQDIAMPRVAKHSVYFRMSPLHWAADKGNVHTVIYEVNREVVGGETPLHQAAREGHVDTVKFFVEKGANIHSESIAGWTPLHRAAEGGHVDTVKFLVEKGANIYSKDRHGKTPQHLAADRGHEEVVAYLKSAADPNMLQQSESAGKQQEQRQSSDKTEIDSQLENLLEKYRHQPTIKHKSLKCLFTGPPRVGKTTLKKRLLRVIKNLITSGVVSPSGGLEKPISVVIGETRECVTVVMESDMDWKPQRDLLDEAQIVLEFIDHQSPPAPAPIPFSPQPVPPTPVTAPAMSVSATADATTAVPSKPCSDPPTPREDKSDTIDDAKKFMQEVLSSRKLRSIKDIEKTTTLYFMDTGGQPEFHEIMPIILSGPALHLIFFNLTFDLDDPIPIRFCHQDGTDSTITYVSSYTGKQMIFQLLSSLYYFSKGLSPNSEPAAVLIGTHLDRLNEQDMMKINDSLNRLLNNVEFHDQGFLTYPTRDKSTIFIPVNNYSGDEEEIHQLQAFLRHVIGDRFRSVELPSSWLLFHLLLRHRYEDSPGVCTLADCRALARGCGLDEKDVPQVLRYIHRHLGTILFYEEVQGLNDLVICDPNVLFKSIYHLVAISFGGDKGYHTITAQIRKTGEIQAQVMNRVGTQSNISPLKNHHIIELLKHFKILTDLPSDDDDDEAVYFMPCLLHPNHSLALTCEALGAVHPTPLLVRFKGNYIPLGVFSALVVKFIDSSWKPDSKSRYRNHILFYTDDDFLVDLIVHSAYLEFRIRITKPREKYLGTVHQYCTEVRKTVVDTLISVLNLYEHTKKTKFQLGFYCSRSFQDNDQPHFCRLSHQKEINPRAFVSSDPPHCQEQCHLPPESNIWLEQWKDPRDQGHAFEALDSVENTFRTATFTQLELRDIQNELEDVTDWYQLGVQLGIKTANLDRIELNNPRNAQQCKTKVLDFWLQNAPECSWMKLAEAVEAMGEYAVLAEELRKKTSQAVK